MGAAPRPSWGVEGLGWVSDTLQPVCPRLPGTTLGSVSGGSISKGVPSARVPAESPITYRGSITHVSAGAAGAGPDGGPQGGRDPDLALCPLCVVAGGTCLGGGVTSWDSSSSPGQPPCVHGAEQSTEHRARRPGELAWRQGDAGHSARWADTERPSTRLLEGSAWGDRVSRGETFGV